MSEYYKRTRNSDESEKPREPKKIGAPGFTLSDYAPLDGVDLSNRDLSSVSLAHSSFIDAELRGTIFNFCNLVGSDFENADLTGASFLGADLTRANFKNAKLISVNFRDTNLTNAIFDEADLEKSDLTGATLTGIFAAYANIAGIKASPNTFHIFEEANSGSGPNLPGLLDRNKRKGNPMNPKMSAPRGGDQRKELSGAPSRTRTSIHSSGYRDLNEPAYRAPNPEKPTSRSSVHSSGYGFDALDRVSPRPAAIRESNPAPTNKRTSIHSSGYGVPDYLEPVAFETTFYVGPASAEESFERIALAAGKKVSDSSLRQLFDMTLNSGLISESKKDTLGRYITKIEQQFEKESAEGQAPRQLAANVALRQCLIALESAASK